MYFLLHVYSINGWFDIQENLLCNLIFVRFLIKDEIVILKGVSDVLIIRVSQV